MEGAVWAAVQTICVSAGLDFVRVKEELASMRSTLGDELCRVDRKQCRQNLLSYYHDVATGVTEVAGGKRFHHAEEYAKVVFVLPVDTDLIESYFGVMSRNKDSKRSGLGDTKVAAVLLGATNRVVRGAAS